MKILDSFIKIILTLFYFIFNFSNKFIEYFIKYLNFNLLLILMVQILSEEMGLSD